VLQCPDDRLLERKRACIVAGGAIGFLPQRCDPARVAAIVQPDFGADHQWRQVTARVFRRELRRWRVQFHRHHEQLQRFELVLHGARLQDDVVVDPGDP